jgi:hypothetical protein
MQQDNEALLVRLNQSGVEFVVIGGVCCVYHAAPVVTFDLDICCRFGEGNLRRLEIALRPIHPVHRLTPQKLPFELRDDLIPDLKNLYLETDLGKLDCLGEVQGIGHYDQVFQNSVEATFSYGRIRFLDLESLIRAKEIAGRDRDKWHLQFLKPIRERLAQNKKPDNPAS